MVCEGPGRCADADVQLVFHEFASLSLLLGTLPGALQRPHNNTDQRSMLCSSGSFVGIDGPLAQETA